MELSGAGGGWTDLSAAGDVFKEGLTISHGIQGSSPLDLVASTGSCTFAMRNSTGNSGTTLGYYSPRHASVRSGWNLGIGCRIRITDPDTSTVHTRFIGRIHAIDPMPGQYRERRVDVIAVDWLDAAARRPGSTVRSEQRHRDDSSVPRVEGKEGCDERQIACARWE